MAEEQTQQTAERQASRRLVLTLFTAGAAATVVPLAADRLRRDRNQPGRAAGKQRPIQVYGGSDSNGARVTTLKVWAARPRTKGLTATYQGVGERSTDQYTEIQNLLAAAPETTDLLVVDAEYLPGLVAAGQVAEFSGRGRGWLVDELGCIGNVARRCEQQGKLYAVPLNTDLPMLAFDTSRIARADQPRLRTLGQLRGSDFWLAALELARNSSGPPESRRLLLQNGEYEGFSACLTELIAAFGTGGPPGAVPDGTVPRTVLDRIREHFLASSFRLAGRGDEEATFNALQDQQVVAARLWPSQCRSLAQDVPKQEAGAPNYTFVPIPGGVLGGQVVAVGRRSTMREQSQELAEYLAAAASQLRLNYNGGYVPTLAELYVDDQLRRELYDVGAEQIEGCVLRPSRPDYADWSDDFREKTRSYLLS